MEVYVWSVASGVAAACVEAIIYGTASDYLDSRTTAYAPSPPNEAIMTIVGIVGIFVLVVPVAMLICAPFVEFYMRACLHFGPVGPKTLALGGAITPVVSLTGFGAILDAMQFNGLGGIQNGFKYGVFLIPAGAVAGYVFWYFGYKPTGEATL